MFHWIYDCPPGGVGVLFASAFVLATSLGIVLGRPIIRRWIHGEKRANDMVGFALSSFSVIYGLLLGLVAVASYQQFSTISENVDKEAATISLIYRSFGAYPMPIRQNLQDQLREYVRYTIEEGWRLQQQSILPQGGTERFRALYETLVKFEPTRRSEEIIHAETLRQFDRLIEIQRSRLLSVNSGLPPLIWFVLGLGAFLNIVLIWMLDMEVHVHLILGNVLALFLGVVIYLIVELDNPLRGEISIGPDALRLIYQTKMAPNPKDEAGLERGTIQGAGGLMGAKNGSAPPLAGAVQQ